MQKMGWTKQACYYAESPDAGVSLAKLSLLRRKLGISIEEMQKLLAPYLEWQAKF